MAYIGTSPSNGVRRRFVYVATANQTSFSGNDENGISLVYVDVAYLDVYQNGVKLKSEDDYASTTGTTVVLVQGASADDVVEIIAFDVFSIGDTVSAADGGNFGGNVGMGGTLAVTGNTTVGGTLGVTGVATFSQKPVFTLGNRGYTHLASAGVAVGGTSATALAFSSTHITSAFTNYMLVLENVQPVTDNKNLLFRPSVDNGSNFTATTLHNLRSIRLSDGGNINNVDNDGGVASLTINSGNDATSGCSGIVHLNGFTDATNFKYFVGHTIFLEADSAYTGWFAASYHTTTAFNHINLTFGSGNIRSGFIHLYGLGE